MDDHGQGGDRDARIRQRQARVEARTALKDDESRKNKAAVTENQVMSQGQQQIADSLAHLDQRKSVSIDDVTAIRVEADARENARRILEEERRQERLRRLQEEAVNSGKRNAAVEMRWAELLDQNMPQELLREITAQKALCSTIIDSKDQLIMEFQAQLKAKDEEYVKALKRQAEDIEALVFRMRAQYKELQEDYELELQNIEEAFLKEREELLTGNKSEIDSLFDRRRAMELQYMDAKQQREEQYQREIDELRVKDAEEYNKLKIKLETDIQTLEQQLEEMRATYQLNTEKLEYNYRVLTERDMENSATRSLQKRKLTRLKDALSTLMHKYQEKEARDRQQNQEHTDDYRRITKQFKDLQTKFRHFEVSDNRKFQEVWQMHEEEMAELVQKVLQADAVIAEQQLGWEWVPPAEDVLAQGISSPPPSSSAPGSADGGVSGGDSAFGGGGGGGATVASAVQQQRQQSPPRGGANPQEESGDGEGSPEAAAAEDEGKGAEQPEGDEQAPAGDQDQDQDDGDLTGKGEAASSAANVSALMIRGMLELLAQEAGFLVDPKVREALDQLPEDEAAVVQADAILQSLGVEDENDVELLLDYFFPDTGDRQRDELNLDAGLPLEESNREAALRRLNSRVRPDDVINVVHRFVRDREEARRSEGAAVAKRPAPTDDMDEEIRRERNRREEREFWERMAGVLSPHTRRVWHALHRAMVQYNDVLRERSELLTDVDQLQRQNAELKGLLNQYLVSKVNDELLVPPTQIIRVERS